jgi:RHS repeat-associated protein
VSTDADGTATFYVYGLGLISQERGGEYRLFHYDYRGSTVALTDENGGITDRWEYSVYGDVTRLDGDTVTIFLYVGQHGIQTDGNGLYYMRARYFSVDLGRFINEDPIRDGVNWYGYCEGNPIRYIDPTGLSPKLLPLVPVIVEGAKKVAKSPAGQLVKQKGGELLHWAGNKIRQGSYWLGDKVSRWFGGGGGTISNAEWLEMRRAIQKDTFMLNNRWGNLSRAADYGIQSHSRMRTALKNTNLQAHHIIEERLGFKINQTVAVTKVEHQIFTNAWRTAIPYGSGKTFTRAEVWLHAQKIYKDYPALLEASRQALGF